MLCVYVLHACVREESQIAQCQTQTETYLLELFSYAAGWKKSLIQGMQILFYFSFLLKYEVYYLSENSIDPDLKPQKLTLIMLPLSVCTAPQPAFQNHTGANQKEILQWGIRNRHDYLLDALWHCLPVVLLYVVKRFWYCSIGRTDLVVRASDSGSRDSPGSILGRVGVLFP